MNSAGGQRLVRWIAPCLLAALTFALYTPVREYEFVQYDDPIYVTDNPSLHAGLSGETLARAFTDPYETNWIPLTWISLQLDHALFGFDAAGYHLVNAGLHALTAALLYVALLSLTLSPGPSLFVAAVFAVHPLHVESVAWISERKDVLSGVFWMLTLLAYAGYARKSEVSGSAGAVARYALVAGCFAAGLLAKPMLVTLPLILLLLDYWPLGRTNRASDTGARRRRRWARLATEKLPLLVMSAIVALVTVRVQRAAGAVATNDPIEPLLRIGNALESYGSYIASSLWPRDLSIFYPHPGSSISPWSAAGIAAALVAFTLLCLRLARSRPYLLVGWLWYVITLLPVIGIVQAGMQARADRYTYLSQTGLAIALAWSARDVFGRRPAGRIALGFAGGAAIAALGVATWHQLPHWRDTRSLYEHAISVTADNFVAHHGLAAELFDAGDYAGAERHYARAAAIKPRWAEAHLGLGDALLAQGRHRKAIASYRRGVRVAPLLALGHVRLASALAEDGQLDRAIEHYRLALVRYGQRPVPEVHARYAAVLAQRNRLTKAAQQYRRALALKPDYAEARTNLGFVLIRAGRYAAARKQLGRVLMADGDSAEVRAGLATAESHLGNSEGAVRHYAAALRLRPNWPPAANNLAWILATHPDPAMRAPQRAIDLIEELERATNRAGPTSLDALAAAYAASGRFEVAEKTAEAAAERARQRELPALAAEIDERRALYGSRRSFIDSSLGNGP